MYIIALVRSIKKESLIPRLSYPIPNGEGFLRDFGTLINPIALAILTSGFLSKDELENRQPMADCRKELLMEIGVSVSMSV